MDKEERYKERVQDLCEKCLDPKEDVEYNFFEQKGFHHLMIKGPLGKAQHGVHPHLIEESTCHPETFAHEHFALVLAKYAVLP